jgi:uracil-DNA glycosylase
VRVIIALGGFAWKAALEMVRVGGGTVTRPLPKFGHLAVATLGSAHGPLALIGCYHPSQQNTFTGRLTPAMLDDVFTMAKTAASAR